MRKVLTALSFAALTALAGLSPAAAQEWPNRPIKLICPFPPGAGADISARIMADALSARLGQSVVVENRAGAGGIVGIEAVAKAAPDGYTLGWPSADPMSLVTAFKKSMPYKVPDDFEIVAKFVETGLTLTISSNVPAKNMAEFVAYGKQNPGKLKIGTSGVAGASDIGSYIFEKNTGTKFTHVHYKGIAPAMTDLLGGHIDLSLPTPASAAPHANNDKVRILAVTSDERHPLLPNVPTMKEVGLPGVGFTAWYGLIAPKGTPAPVLERLRKEITWIVAQPDIKEKVSKAALQIAPSFGEDFRKAILKEIADFKAISESEKISVED